ARATGRAAAVLTSTGPGALNALSELADARWASLPLLHVTTSIGEPTFAAAVHETPEQSDLMAMVGKACVSVGDGAGDGVAGAVARAVALAMTQPRGPVTLDLRVGTFGNPAAPGGGPIAPEQRDLDPRELVPLAEALDAARRPVLYVGGGALRSDDGAAVRDLAALLGAPVVTSYQGKTVADWTCDGYLGPWAGEVGVQALFAEADLAVVLGAKLSASGTDAWRLPLPGPGFRVDLAPNHHRHYPDLRPITADVGAAARWLTTILKPRPAWASERVRTLRAEVVASARERGPVEMGYVGALAAAEALPRLLTYDMSKGAFWAEKYLPGPPGSVQAVSSYLAMGTALPMAIGMSVATGEPVLSILGDGGLQMSIAELATLAELQLPVTLVVLVDHAYGLLRDNGRLVAGSENVGVALWNPDYRKLAAAYGIECRTLAGADDLRQAMDKPAEGPRLLLLTEGFSRAW
ncbi:MAG TPA: thiamine pyrophosphate-dependent enzyme, partial [Sporichthya sp.]|nr:thiamine pyrophosphate-dependent enzyme [Sporichthya sp.]